MRNRECVNCALLSGCTRTSGEKLLSHYVCEVFKEEPTDEVIRARLDIINKFGSAGVQSVISPDTEKEG